MYIRAHNASWHTARCEKPSTVRTQCSYVFYKKDFIFTVYFIVLLEVKNEKMKCIIKTI